MELKEILAALRAAWWLPLIGCVIGGAAGLGLSILTVPVYTSQTQLFVSTTDTSSTSDVFQGSQFSQQRVTSYADLVTGDQLLDRVIRRLHLHMTPQELAKEVDATAVTQTVLLDVTVTDPSPQRARSIADAIGAEFSRMVAELETPDGAATSPVKVTVVDTPQLATSPSEPKPVRNIVLGVILGGLLGATVAILRARMDRSIRDQDEASAIVGAPVIGVILRAEALEKRHVLDWSSPNNRTAEDFRQLRTNLQFLNVDEPPRIIMVSSALPSEGKTTLVVNLGMALAEMGKTVTIVEADLRRPKVTRYLGLISGVGLTNILAGSAEIDDVIQKPGAAELSVIAAGPMPPNPGELLASSQMATLLEKLGSRKDFVLIDAPPLLPVADSSGVAAHTDGVLLSVRYGTTRREQLQQAAATLERVGARTLGVILNIVPANAELATTYGYGYDYGYGARHSEG